MNILLKQSFRLSRKKIYSLLTVTLFMAGMNIFVWFPDAIKNLYSTPQFVLIGLLISIIATAVPYYLIYSLTVVVFLIVKTPPFNKFVKWLVYILVSILALWGFLYVTLTTISYANKKIPALRVGRDSACAKAMRVVENNTESFLNHVQCAENPIPTTGRQEPTHEVILTYEASSCLALFDSQCEMREEFIVLDDNVYTYFKFDEGNAIPHKIWDLTHVPISNIRDFADRRLVQDTNGVFLEYTFHTHFTGSIRMPLQKERQYISTDASLLIPNNIKVTGLTAEQAINIALQKAQRDGYTLASQGNDFATLISYRPSGSWHFFISVDPPAHTYTRKYIVRVCLDGETPEEYHDCSYKP